MWIDRLARARDAPWKAPRIARAETVGLKATKRGVGETLGRASVVEEPRLSAALTMTIPGLRVRPATASAPSQGKL